MKYIELVLEIYLLLMIFTILLTWIPKAKDTKINKILNKITQPYFSLFEGIPNVGMFNIAPLIAILIYQIAAQTLIDILYKVI